MDAVTAAGDASTAGLSQSDFRSSSKQGREEYCFHSGKQNRRKALPRSHSRGPNSAHLHRPASPVCKHNPGCNPETPGLEIEQFFIEISPKLISEIFQFVSYESH